MPAGQVFMPYEFEMVTVSTPTDADAGAKVTRLRRVPALDASGAQVWGSLRVVWPRGPKNSALVKNGWLNLSVGEGDARIKWWLFSTTPDGKSINQGGDDSGTKKVLSDARWNLHLPDECDAVAVKFLAPHIDVPLAWSLELDPS